jgi:flagellar basal body rod protein FlgC
LFDRTQSTVAIINGVKVEAFPSHHVDTMRGLDNVKFILSDETDYYPPFQQTEVRAVMEGYIGKPNSDPTIVMVSTPKAPGGLMQQIELEPDSLYHKLFFDYTYIL